MRLISEEQLIKKAAAGDAEAFELLVIRYQTPVYRLCFRMLGNAEDAADLTQEAFLKAWRSLDGFQFKAAFSTWLYRLASNLCLDHLRSAKRCKTLPLIVVSEDSEELAVDLPDPAPLPEEHVILSEEQQHLQTALAALPSEERQLLTLRVINELSYAEIAELLAIKEGTVKSRLSRVRERLRKKRLKIRNDAAAASSK